MQAVSDNDAPALEDSAEALRRFVEGLRDAIFGCASKSRRACRSSRCWRT